MNLRRIFMLAGALGVAGFTVLAVAGAHAAPTAGAPAAVHNVQLSDGDVDVIAFVFAQRAGRGCSIDEDRTGTGGEPAGLLACREALAAHDVLARIRAQIAAQPAKAAPGK